MQVEKTLRRIQTMYPTPVRYFGCTKRQYGTNEWRRRRVVANILVGGSKDENAVAATEWIFKEYTFSDLANRRKHRRLFRHIADTIENDFDIRFAGRKTKYILESAVMLKEEFRGSVPRKESELRRLPGVAEHAAAVIRGLAFDEQTFAIDTHVRRILKRMKIVPMNAKDREIIREFSSLEESQKISRALVDFGKDICAYNPRCARCPFKNFNCKKSIKK